jgi:hypothetical protein
VDNDSLAERDGDLDCLALLVAAQAPSFAAKNNKKAAAAQKRLLEKASGPITLTVESVDRAAAKVVVRIGGVARAPEARLFTFHDDRQRHFIALSAACEAAPAEPAEAGKKAAPATVKCALGYPPPYLTAHVRGLSLHLGERDIVLAMAVFVNSFPIGVGLALLICGGLAGEGGWRVGLMAPPLACALAMAELQNLPEVQRQAARRLLFVA